MERGASAHDDVVKAHDDEAKVPSNSVSLALGHDRSVHPVGRERQDSRIAEDRRPQPRWSFRGLRAPEEGGPNDSRGDRLWALFSRHTTIILVILYLVYSSVSTVVRFVFKAQEMYAPCTVDRCRVDRGKAKGWVVSWASHEVVYHASFSSSMIWLIKIPHKAGARYQEDQAEPCVFSWRFLHALCL